MLVMVEFIYWNKFSRTEINTELSGTCVNDTATFQETNMDRHYSTQHCCLFIISSFTLWHFLIN